MTSCVKQPRIQQIFKIKHPVLVSIVKTDNLTTKACLLMADNPKEEWSNLSKLTKSGKQSASEMPAGRGPTENSGERLIKLYRGSKSRYRVFVDVTAYCL